MTTKPTPAPDNPDYIYDLFISHSAADRDWMRTWLLPQLDAADVRVCLADRDFEPGLPRLAAVERAIGDCRRTAVILTPAWLAEPEQVNVFEMAFSGSLAGANRRVLPVVRHACDPPLFLRHLIPLDMTDRATQTELSETVARLIAAATNRPVREKPVPGFRRDFSLIPVTPYSYMAHPYPMPANFTGRAQERAMLSQWQMRDPQPILQVVALGGMGKSALTWHWLHQDAIRDAHVGIVWWSFYEAAADFDLFVFEALRYASGHQVDPRKIPGRGDRTRHLLKVMRERRVLLILDGFERELRAYAGLGAAYQGDEADRPDDGDPGAGRACVNPHAADFLRTLASAPTKSKVLITTRLAVRDLEDRHDHTPLAGCRVERLTALAPADAVHFLRAQGIDKGTDAELRAAGRAYGFHPLSLRLLAGRVANDRRSPGDIRAMPRHDVAGDLVQRQHHVLESAFDGLDGVGRGLLTYAAAFRSPISHQALRTSPMPEQERPKRRWRWPWTKEKPQTLGERTLDRALDDLMDRGLLLWDRATNRYDLHPIVRRYAYDRLVDKAGAHTRLRDYFAAVPAPEQVESAADLAPVMELYHHTVRAGRFDEAFKILRDRLVPNPLYYRFGAYGTIIDLLRPLFPDGEDAPPRLSDPAAQGWTLNELANSYSLSGRPRQAVPLFEMQIAIRQKQGVQQSVAIGLGNLAHQQIAIGALADAEANLRRRITLCREIEDEFNEAIGHAVLGRTLAYRGAFEEAETELDTATRIFENENELQFLGVTWAYRALTSLLRARSLGSAAPLAHALSAAEKARELANEVARTLFPVERDFVRAEWLLGAIKTALASYASPLAIRPSPLPAEPHLTEALTRCRRIGMVDHEPDILLAWAEYWGARGELRGAEEDFAQARQVAEEALGIAQRCEYRLAEADAHLVLARLARHAGDGHAARRHLQIAQERAWCDGPPHAYQVALDEAARLLAEMDGAV